MIGALTAANRELHGRVLALESGSGVGTAEAEEAEERRRLTGSASTAKLVYDGSQIAVKLSLICGNEKSWKNWSPFDRCALT